MRGQSVLMQNIDSRLGAAVDFKPLLGLSTLLEGGYRDVLSDTISYHNARMIT